MNIRKNEDPRLTSKSLVWKKMKMVLSCVGWEKGFNNDDRVLGL